MESRVSTSIIEILSCHICGRLCTEPVQCYSCGVLYCASCISEYFYHSSACPQTCDKSYMGAIGKGFHRVLSGLNVKCKHLSCAYNSSVLHIRAHESHCGAQCDSSWTTLPSFQF